MYFHSYLRTAVQILEQYKGETPFASFLKKFFSQDKKYGSKDRKHISHLCYCFFRSASHPVKEEKKISSNIEEEILRGLLLCSTKENEILQALKPEWNAKVRLSSKEKYSIPMAIGSNSQYSITTIFPWKEELSYGIEYEKFCESFLIQPDLFLRLRPRKEKIAKDKLNNAGIDFKIISDSCLALENATKVDSVIELDKEAVIQDYSSQQTGDFIKSGILNLIPIAIGTKITAWDCCAGSGGKSIMLYDINPEIQLTVSDKRESILANLKKRFEKAGIKNYKSFIADLESDKSEILNLPAGRQGFKSEIIIADVPCTGSGTWSRTPEQLYFFDKEKINEYAALQKKIISNVIPHLQQGGYLVYITCSVFKKENEEVVASIKDQFNMELLKMELLKGYERKADSMFIAIFKKQS